MQPLRKVQLRRMEINMDALGATYVKRRATILDKGTCILDFDRFIWI